MGSKLDQIYRSLLQTKFFSRGWGKPENLKKIFEFRRILSNREECMKLVDPNHPITITKEVDNGEHIIIDAEFRSPMCDHLPGLLPKQSEKAYFQLILPKNWKGHHKPTCIHFAGTGDHGFWRRRVLMGKPLIQESGIASILHENPFYGVRKPPEQRGSSLLNVSDLFLMGGCLVVEGIALLHWAERQGFGPIGITGISMGGHMASLVACSWNKPIPLIPCLSWSTASHVFTQGVLSGSVNWDTLKNQYFSHQIFRDELFNMIHSPEGHFKVFHEVGQKFAREFPQSLEHVKILNQSQGTKDNNTELKSSPPKTPHNIPRHNLISKENIQKKTSPDPLSIFSKFGLTKIGDPVSNSTKSSLLLKYQQDKSNISNPKITPKMEIRPSNAKDTPPVTFEPYVNVRDSLTWEALQFMRGIMDECTHLGNFAPPVDPSLSIVVVARDDAYMPHNGVIPLNKLWPEAEIRTLNTGHITAFLFNQQVFRQAITDSFGRAIVKYHSVENKSDIARDTAS